MSVKLPRFSSGLFPTATSSPQAGVRSQTGTVLGRLSTQAGQALQGTDGHTAAAQPTFTALTSPWGTLAPSPEARKRAGCGRPLLAAQCCAGRTCPPVSTHKATAQG